MTINDMQDISTLLEQGAKLEAVKLRHLTTVSFQVELVFSTGTKEDELKACPFCGGHASVVMDVDTHLFDRYKIVCDECNTEGAYATKLEDAVEAWNRRASDE